MSKDLECPYCEEWNEVCHDDGGGYAEDQNHEMQCAHCQKHFVFQTSISFHYESSPADCLNGSPHDITEWATIDERDGLIRERRRCKDCDHDEWRTRATNKEESKP